MHAAFRIDLPRLYEPRYTRSDTIQEHRMIGVVRVPRLDLSVAVVEGVDEDSLSIGAGHMPGTALLGQPGNVVIAAHRDLAFHPLRKIALGDVVQVDAARPYQYRVDKISIVDPDDVSVLANSRGSTLTLITCYPFGFIGNAPKRFVVRATLMTNAG